MQTELPLRGAWREIDQSALAGNMRQIRKMVGEKPLIMPVVKADAYGHGACRCAQILLENGADRFAVASLQEASALRDSGITAPILCLGYLPPRQYGAAIAYDIAIAVYTWEQGLALSRAAMAAGKTATVHIKVDSGFGRLGFAVNEDSAQQVYRISQLPGLKLEGVFSHFAAADEKDKSFCHQQHAQFERFIAMCAKKGVTFQLRHIANSAAVIDLPQYIHEMCRPGIILYGYSPSAEVTCPGLQTVMSVKAEIARLMSIPKGAKVGSACTWQAQRDSVIATIPLGYADGVSRLLQPKGGALIKGQYAPIAGRVCMDYIMLDVTDIVQRTPLKPGDIVTIIGQDGAEKITAEDMADQMGTISYEIMCMLGNRLPKVYING